MAVPGGPSQERRFNGEEDSSSSDEDMETLRRVRILAGMNAGPSSAAASAPAAAADTAASASAADLESEDDEELIRSSFQRCGVAPLFLKPLSFIPPSASDGEEDEYELLSAIRKRFVAYESGSLRSKGEDNLQKHEQVRAPSITSEKETSSNLLFENKTNYCEGCPDSEDACNANQSSHVNKNQPSGYIDWHQSDTNIPFKDSSFPKTAQVFLDAIKKNRSCQKFLRSKLIQIESKLAENKKLKDSFKVLKDFRASCRRGTGRVLSQKKGPLVQLISVPKLRASKIPKVDRKVAAMCYGPAENAHVANYRIALSRYPRSLNREKWLKEDSEKLDKGIKEQFQKMAFQMSVDFCRGSEGFSGESIDDIMTSIAEFKLTPELMNLFLPKVDWQQLVAGHTGPECESRWLNWDNPLINHSQWTVTEDRNLLHIVKEKGYYNWIDTALLLGTNRTPFQCLARFQRSLNTFILKSEWTEDEDAQLRKAVETFGESNWQFVASALEGRTGTQCSNRWNKTLHPMRKREGRWASDEDKRLKVAVMLLGPKSWNKIAQFVPGRTQVQCRERWVNSLDPALNWAEWTEEEDSKLQAAIKENGYCWSKVAKCVPPRTDNQCRRRWKLLCPHEVPLLQAAKKIKKVALISNFVDRESERPALSPNDFVPLPALQLMSTPENEDCAEQKKSSMKKPKSKKKIASSRNVPRRTRKKKSSEEAQICCEEAVAASSCDQVETCGGEAISRKKVRKPRSNTERCTEPTQDPVLCSAPKVMTNVSKRIRRKKCSEEAQICSEGEVAVTNCDQIETFGDNVSRKKRVGKPHSQLNNCMEPTQDHELYSGSKSTGEVVEETGDASGDTTGRDCSTLETESSAGRNPSSEEARCTTVHDHSSPCEDSILQRFTNGGEIEALTDATKKILPPRQHQIGNKCHKVQNGGGDDAPVRRHTVKRCSTKRKAEQERVTIVATGCNFIIPGSSNSELLGADITKNRSHERASSNHQDGLESLEGTPPGPKQVSATVDDAMTLASFLRSKRKKIKLALMKNNYQAS